MMNKKEASATKTIVQPSGPKSYLVAAFVIALLVLAIIPVWFALGVAGGEGGHQHGGVTISEEWFMDKLKAQQEKYGLPDGSVKFPPGSTVYILAQQFAFVPGTVRLVFGGSYELIFFSTDVSHGVSLIQSGSVNMVIAPDMTARMSIRATQLGEIKPLCNEYCGAAHHLMQAKIIVE